MPGSLFSSSRSVVVAAAHASAPPLDRDAGVAKACQIIADASAAGARLVVFSESFIPGFPIWTGIFPPVDGHSLFRRFAENALNPQDKPFRTIMEAAARHRIYVSLGFCEVSSRSPGRLWNSQALISDEGVLLNLHRKLVPTYYEQLVWDRGDSEGLRVMDTPIGRIGGLVCGENNNPLARYVLMGEGEEIHCACYPAIWPFRNPVNGPIYDLRDAIRFRAAAHSFEAKVFTIVASGMVDDALIDTFSGGDPDKARILRACPPACSMIIGPTGELVSEVRQDEEGLVLAELDLASLVELRRHHDMAGYYCRSDVFRLRLERQRAEVLEVIDAPSGALIHRTDVPFSLSAEHERDEPSARQPQE
ncbi:carbon-nitrogen hydrolase family protein [Stutzerimonas azotifigens]|uniref:carbon-nitrogen hydrolase family protein n=1 Tax=Stutzerimonas azotifigens TaxID=291995 RepID=UPI0012690751|nr:carbon-nitrogen hydrolase family protein [Stutzerimonas azotifigens]